MSWQAPTPISGFVALSASKQAFKRWTVCVTTPAGRRRGAGTREPCLAARQMLEKEPGLPAKRPIAGERREAFGEEGLLAEFGRRHRPISPCPAPGLCPAPASFDAGGAAPHARAQGPPGLLPLRLCLLAPSGPPTRI